MAGAWLACVIRFPRPGPFPPEGSDFKAGRGFHGGAFVCPDGRRMVQYLAPDVCNYNAAYGGGWTMRVTRD